MTRAKAGHSLNVASLFLQMFDPPCCVPIEYEPLSLLIIEDEETEKVNVKTFQKMVVTGCGCR